MYFFYSEIMRLKNVPSQKEKDSKKYAKLK